MTKTYISLLAFFLISCSSYSETRFKPIHFDEPIQYQKELDDIKSIKNFVDSRFINYLKNDETFGRIVNLCDSFVFGCYTIQSNTNVSNNAVIIDYMLIYKIPEKQCWYGRMFAVNSNDSCYSNYWLNLNENNKIKSDFYFNNNAYVYEEDENGFNKFFNLFVGDVNYKNSYGFAKKSKEDIVDIYNDDFGNNYFYGSNSVWTLQDSFVWENE